MKKLFAIALVVSYVGIGFVGVPIAGPWWSPWLLAVLSALFVWSFMHIARGRASVALIIVALFSVVFPIAVLTAIGWKNYSSFGAQMESMLSTFREYGQFWGLEMLFPLLGAAIVAGITQRMRSNSSFQGSPASGRP